MSAATVTVVLSGCSASLHPGSAAVNGNAVDEAAFDLMNRGAGYQQDAPLIHAAQEELIRRCMLVKGMMYIKTPYVQLSAAQAFTGTPQGYARLLLERQTHGYGIAENLARNSAHVPPAPLGANDLALARLTETQHAAYTLAFIGRDSARKSLRLPGGSEVTYSDEGCLADANRQIYGSTQEAAELSFYPQIVKIDLDNKLKSAPKVLAAQRLWAKCMTLQGVDYATESDMVNALGRQFAAGAGATPANRSLEVRLAIAATRCSQSSGLTDTKNTVERELVAALPNDQQGVLLRLEEVQGNAARRAKAVAGGAQ